MKIDFSPTKGQTRCANQINVYQTLIEPNVMAVALRHDEENEAAYIFLLKKVLYGIEEHIKDIWDRQENNLLIR